MGGDISSPIARPFTTNLGRILQLWNLYLKVSLSSTGPPGLWMGSSTNCDLNRSASFIMIGPNLDFKGAIACSMLLTEGMSLFLYPGWVSSSNMAWFGSSGKSIILLLNLTSSGYSIGKV
eukprot:CAMPEP_0116925450 /NCGR_PEP_ID=MMETSP0467-20121206/24129_1 /TAXON_ID=283647 /ORGANISM="Mesodinium pulex, Strain SPMC105" /LENGTH=119 /DNA_ID=CAMNT_0004604503 /DNA_START=366 /DNA_END=725 /DNA_ORIENTATION=+